MKKNIKPTKKRCLFCEKKMQGDFIKFCAVCWREYTCKIHHVFNDITY